MPSVAYTSQMAVIIIFYFDIKGHFEISVALRAEMTDKPVNCKACEICLCLLTNHSPHQESAVTCCVQ